MTLQPRVIAILQISDYQLTTNLLDDFNGFVVNLMGPSSSTGPLQCDLPQVFGNSLTHPWSCILFVDDLQL